MKDFIDIQEFLKDILGENANIFSFKFSDKIEWKKHTLKRYGYCDEYLIKKMSHLIKDMANMNISVARYDNNTNEGIVLDRRENIR